MSHFAKCLKQHFIWKLSVCLLLLIFYNVMQKYFTIVWRENVNKCQGASPDNLKAKYIEGNNARNELSTEKHRVNSVLKNITGLLSEGRPTSNNVSTAKLKGKLEETARAQRNAKKVIIGILIPSCTRKLKNPALENLSLTTICLPSLYKTFEEKYLYHIYIGIDKGDYLESVKEEITSLFSNITVVTIHFPIKTFTRSVNAVARKAYEDGVEYFVRINDDTSFETKNWASSALYTLQNYSPPNVGVVGPTCNEGNKHILTHDMVHRTHLEMFGSYYPLYFDNVWSDDWITNIYRPERLTILTSWIVKHHFRFHNSQYDVHITKYSRLKHIVNYDKGLIAEYLNRTVNKRVT